MFNKTINFVPKKDIPSLNGKVILITGGNNGLGKQSALELVQHNPLEIWVAARNYQKGKAVVEELNTIAPGTSVRLLELDLSSFDSVKAAAKLFLASVSRLDILMLNAGVLSGPDPLTKDGYELRFGTNHMGHALLTKLLTPLLLKTAATTSKSEIRVVCLSSHGHRVAPSGGIQFDSLKDSQMGVLEAYSQSKLANLLFAQQMAKQYPQFITVSVDPGNIGTGLFDAGGAGWIVWAFTTFFAPFMNVSVEEGAKNQLWAATSGNVESGEYYAPVGVTGKASAVARDEKLAKKLWDWTEKELEGQEI